MNVLYEVHNGLYINFTNRCTCACTFCIRQSRDHMNDSGSLWLEREPSVDEVIALLKERDLSKYKEIVFCGYGEPSERMEDAVEICHYLRGVCDLPIRMNTNGLGNLSHREDITPQFKGNFDAVSISLNTPDPVRYYELTRNIFGIAAFSSLLDFTRRIKNYVPSVTMTTVSTTLSEQEEEQCRKICEGLGVKYRIREFQK